MTDQVVQSDQSAQNAQTERPSRPAPPAQHIQTTQPSRQPQPSCVFFIDVDNTLLDNDKIKESIRQALMTALGEDEAGNFWRHHDEFRSRQQLVDFPNIIKQYCQQHHAADCDIRLGQIFENIFFKAALFPRALEVVRHLKQYGSVFVFSEGDAKYQRGKIDESGITAAVDEVYCYTHKLKYLPELIERYSSSRLFFIDDRAEKLADIKREHPQVTTILVCQGHYNQEDHAPHQPADVTVDTVGELLKFDPTQPLPPIPPAHQSTGHQGFSSPSQQS